MAWKAGLSDNAAHFRYTPGAHGGTVTAFDDAACELIDPDFARPLRPLAPVAQLDFEEPEVVAQEPPPAPKLPRARKGKPAVPGGRMCCSACAPAASADRA